MNWFLQVQGNQNGRLSYLEISLHIRKKKKVPSWFLKKEELLAIHFYYAPTRQLSDLNFLAFHSYQLKFDLNFLAFHFYQLKLSGHYSQNYLMEKSALKKPSNEEIVFLDSLGLQ